MKYTKEILQEAVDNSISYAGVLRHLGLKWAGGTQAHIKKQIIKLCIDTTHFTGQGHSKGSTSLKKLKPEEILTLNRIDRRESAHKLRRALLESGMEYKCNKCGIKDWGGQQLVLEVNHKNNDCLDNRKDNLEFICPNCHSQLLGTNGRKYPVELVKSSCQAHSPKKKICLDCEKLVSNGGSRCKSCAGKLKMSTVCKRPNKDDLEKDIKEIKYFTKVGKKYGVSDNTVRKWCKIYNINLCRSGETENAKVLETFEL